MLFDQLFVCDTHRTWSTSQTPKWLVATETFSSDRSTSLRRWVVIQQTSGSRRCFINGTTEKSWNIWPTSISGWSHYCFLVCQRLKRKLLPSPYSWTGHWRRCQAPVPPQHLGTPRVDESSSFWFLTAIIYKTFLCHLEIIKRRRGGKTLSGVCFKQPLDVSI